MSDGYSILRDIWFAVLAQESPGLSHGGRPILRHTQGAKRVRRALAATIRSYLERGNVTPQSILRYSDEHPKGQPVLAVFFGQSYAPGRLAQFDFTRQKFIQET